MPDMPGPWIINVGGRAYGPYTAEQMRAFVSEGRLVAMSQVTRAGDTEFRNALDDPGLAPLFVPSKAPKPVATEPPGQNDVERPSAFGKFESNPADEATPEVSHFIVAADMKSRSIQDLEKEIHKLGPAYPVLPQVWLLNTEASISAVRNLLVQQLGKLDILFVVDATRDKAAWFNFAPEKEARIRKIWTKTPETKVRA